MEPYVFALQGTWQTPAENEEAGNRDSLDPADMPTMCHMVFNEGEDECAWQPLKAGAEADSQMQVRGSCRGLGLD